MKQNDPRKLWLVEHPTHQYNEDVKALARQNHLKIYDSKLGIEFDPSRVEQNPPKLSKKDEKKTRKKAAKPVEEQVVVEE